jgi:spermidine synthase
MDNRQKGLSRAAIELIAASFIVLFQELILIRWMAGQVRVLAYFPNLILLSAFLGLGLGCLRSEKKPLLWFWPISILFLTCMTYFMSKIVFTQNAPSEHLWLLYYDLPKTAIKISSIKLPIMLSYIMSSFTFVPLGQIIGKRLKIFQSQGKPLMGYVYDLIGSILGVILFALISISGIFPVYWFAILFSVGIILFLSRKKKMGIYFILAILVIASVLKAEKAAVYSPYYALSFERNKYLCKVLVNGSLHQVALNLRREKDSQSESKFNVIAKGGYHYPYSLLEQKPKQVLVLGAGTGNDVATLLDQNIEKIDAVEIDPVIIEFGKKYHPNKPYESSRVTIFNDDARSFLNKTKKVYDLIVFGTLDSQTRLSALSNARLDSFVYTSETIKAAKKCLAKDGGMILYFMVGKNYIGERLVALLTKEFDELPVIHIKHYGLFNYILMAGPAFSKQLTKEYLQVSKQFKNKYLPFMDVPSDDWPYLYLKNKTISLFYLEVMLFISVFTIISIMFVSKTFRKGFLDRRMIDGEMFLFGLGFLLLETRSVTEMNLLWGSTWINSAVVFCSVLLVILFGTLLTKHYLFPFKIGAVGLVISLMAVYFLPIQIILGATLVKKLLFSLIVVGVPIFFASLCFARIFAMRSSIDNAFGWNLFGAVCGGMLEFLSMALGLKALLLIALLAYLIAFLLILRQERYLGGT